MKCLLLMSLHLHVNLIFLNLLVAFYQALPLQKSIPHLFQDYHSPVFHWFHHPSQSPALWCPVPHYQTFDVLRIRFLNITFLYLYSLLESFTYYITSMTLPKWRPSLGLLWVCHRITNPTTPDISMWIYKIVPETNSPNFFVPNLPLCILLPSVDGIPSFYWVGQKNLSRFFQYCLARETWMNFLHNSMLVKVPNSLFQSHPTSISLANPVCSHFFLKYV